MKKLFFISCAFLAFQCFPVANAAIESSSVTRIYESMQTTPSTSPLLGTYKRIRQDAVRFPYDIAQNEFKEKYGISSPVFPGGLLGDAISTYTPVGQLNAFRQYERDYAKMLADAQFFTDTYLYAKYKNIFTNDDISDSGYDLMVKTNEIVNLVEPQQAGATGVSRYPGFALGLTPLARTIMGDQYASVIDNKDEREQKIQALKQNGGYIFGATELQDQCVMPGETVTELGTAELTEGEKNAILGRIADMENARTLDEDKKSLSTLLPNQYEKPVWLRVLEGEQVQGIRECLDRVCFSVTPIYKQPQLAQRTMNTTAIQQTINELKVVLEEAKTRDLSAQCAVKKAFGTPWYNKEVKPVFSPPIITFVPMFVELKYSKIITADILFKALMEWDSIATAPIKDQNTLGVQASQQLVSAANESIAAIADLEARKQVYKASLGFRADLQNQHEQMKIISQEFTSLQSELELFLKTVMSIRETSLKMQNIPKI